ncbi:MAG: EAL domain-containing protein [Dehalococcoidia bacterium]
MQDVETTVIMLQALRELGVRVAIDDFGTGYSSMSYLRRFLVDTLKVDQSFIRGIAYDTGSLSIVQAVVTLADALGLDVTAEGIETEKQLRLLRLLRCPRAQGYYFARPLPADALAVLLLGERP